MAKPDWNARQHPEQKAKEHGHHGNGHGPAERGMGAERDPEHEHGPKQAPDDLTIQEPEDGEEVAVGSEPLGVVYASAFLIPNVPPVTDQGTTPRCVAHSNGYDTNQQDRPELGRFNNLDEALFFQQIGGGPNGAYMTAGLNRRRDFGYPEAINVPAQGGYPAQDGNRDYAQHRIAGYTQIALTPTAIKDALLRGHGVLFIGDWFHSWFHPFASGKLPAPDYKVGGHAIWCRGWNDSYGFRLRNSWGTDYGVGGDVFLPYAFLSRMYAAYRTTDK